MFVVERYENGRWLPVGEPWSLRGSAEAHRDRFSADFPHDRFRVAPWRG